VDLDWFEDLLPEGFLKKRMFGGFAYYLDEKLVLLLFESTGNHQYRGQHYDFEIWNGCMFPVEKENQSEIVKRFPFLISHPILPKWLYLPFETENFDELAESLLRELRRRNPLMGTIPKPKSSKRAPSGERRGKGKGSSRSLEDEEIIDTRRPKMFSEDSAEEVLKKARKITDLKNLGPESEKVLNLAGISSAPQLIRLGWKKAMIQICESDPKHGHSIFAYAVIGALQNKMWNLISEEDKKAARELMKSLRQNPPGNKQKSSPKKTRRKAIPKKPKQKASKKSLNEKKTGSKRKSKT
jgi:hypothetical protein